MARPIKWLHLSDLHAGHPNGANWGQMLDSWKAHIKEMAKELGMPDLILFTGDLSSWGTKAHFQVVDSVLDNLLKWLKSAATGPEPLLLPVPGNHDLARPQGSDKYRYAILDSFTKDDNNFAADLDNELLQGDRSGKECIQQFIQPLFADYLSWFNERVTKSLKGRATLHQSIFPGDYSITFNTDGAFPLGMVGLNSTWLQWRGSNNQPGQPDEFQGKLWLSGSQFQAALPASGTGSPLDALDGWDRTLLMMHQPPDWLHPKSKQEFDEMIFHPDKVDLCLFGHMHEAESDRYSRNGGHYRNVYQAPSLFSVEDDHTSKVTRNFGCTWGEIHRNGLVNIWPFKYKPNQGSYSFLWDQSFGPQQAQGKELRPADDKFKKTPKTRGAAKPTRPAATRKPRKKLADLTAYIKSLVEETRNIWIMGMGSAEGSVRGTLTYPIERLFIPLHVRGGVELESREESLPLRVLDRQQLSKILFQNNKLLIIGDAGAGKSTFLNLLACLMGRDFLGLPHPRGGTWQQQELGVDHPSPSEAPVLIRLSDLVVFMTGKDAPRNKRDDRFWLSRFLEQCCGDNKHGVTEEQWTTLFDGGNTALLLDGLDEVGDEKLRLRLMKIFQDVLTHWGNNRLVISSRPMSQARLEGMGFPVATIQPFSNQDIEAFAARWVPGVFNEQHLPDLSPRARTYRDELLKQILGRADIRAIATTPVMLTCLCVVHFNENRKLPEGRTNVYQAIIRWMLGSRTTLRAEKGYNDDFALRAMARLALAMMGPGGMKKVQLDLNEAVNVVLPEVQRDFRDKATTQDAQKDLARAWLEFECLGSGIIDLRPPAQVRFRHLTFQEYLAAKRLSWLDDQGPDSWQPILEKHLHDPLWAETLEFLPLSLTTGGVGRADKLMKFLLEKAGEDSTGLVKDAKIVGALGRMLAPLAVINYTVTPEVEPIYSETRKRVMAIFEEKGAAQVPWQQRIEAAEALGRAGDERLSRGDDYLFLPIPGFQGSLGRFPVTVQEFSAFINQEGYQRKEFWTTEGWNLRQSQKWEEPEGWENQFPHRNRPVTGVSWFEAKAYCRWLSEKKRGVHVDLPTNEIWEAAAGLPQREYPWGEGEPDEERAHFYGKAKGPTPVGIYPKGAGPHGHLDLAGNVWEWTSNVYEADKDDFDRWKKIFDEEILASGWFWLRGGSWVSPAQLLRSVLRLWYPADFRFDFIGFRVWASPASP